MQWKGYVVSSDQGEWEKNTSDKILAQLIKRINSKYFKIV